MSDTLRLRWIHEEMISREREKERERKRERERERENRIE